MYAPEHDLPKSKEVLQCCFLLYFCQVEYPACGLQMAPITLYPAYQAMVYSKLKETSA